MKTRRTPCSKTGKRGERGFSLLEAMVASFIMLIGIGGLMALFVVAATKNAGQGDQATRCTEYAQDKMEQLLALNYSDTTSQVAGPITICSSCTGYNSALAGGLAENDTLSTTAGFVDYVDSTGAIVTTQPSNKAYIRQWTVVLDSTKNVKTITVYVQAQFTVDILAPSTTLIAVKEQY